MKDFDEFLKTLDSKDWSLVADSIGKKIEGKSHEESMLLANIYATTTILREYHEWLNK